MNFKHHSILYFIISLSIFLLGSCKDDHDHEHAAPEVTFLSPTLGAQLNESDTLWLRINLNSSDDIHDYVVEVTKVSDGTSVYKYEGHSHAKSVAINQYFFSSVDANTDMKLTVTTLDHNGKANAKSIIFTVLNNQQALKPVITLTSPSSSMATNGQTLNIEGTISHDKQLQSARVILTKNNVTVLDYLKDNIGATTYSFDTSHVINTTTHTDYTLTITAKDIFNVESSKTVGFHVHP